jgi:hypothetical protein
METGQKVVTARTTAGANPPVGGFPFWQRCFVPFGFYVLGAIIFTWPLVLRLGNGVINAASGDTWQHLWHLWWVKHSLLDLRVLPYYTEMLYYPQRVDLLLDSLNVSTGVISIPFQLIFGLVPTYNLVTILSVVFSGYFTFLLAGYLIRDYRVAFVSGVIFAFCPLVSFWINLGQLDLIPAFWFPLYLLFYLKTLRGDNWKWNGAGAALVFVVMSLTSWYFTYYGLIISGLVLLWHLFSYGKKEERRANWRGILLRGIATPALAGLLLSPILLRTMSAVGGEQNLGRQTYYNFWLNSAALFDFIKPGPSAIWGIFGAKETSDYQWLFLGFVALALALIGLVTQLRQLWFWGLTGLVFFEISLGPTLRLFVKDEVLATAADAENGLPTLNRLLYALPFGDIARIPAVSVIGLYLMLAILAAYGLNWLMPHLKFRQAAVVVPVVASALIFLEFLPLPRIIADTSYTGFYEELSRMPEEFAVIDLPEKGDYLAMYYQTLHGKPIVGGYTARQPGYPFALTPGIKELRATYPSTRPRDIFDPALLENTPAVLYYYNIRYVIYHKNLPEVSEAYQEAHLEYINGVFQNSPPVYKDEEIIVWKVTDLPGAVNPCGAKSVLPGRLGGWNERLINDKGEVYRWMDGKSEVIFFNPSKQPVKVNFEVEVQSWQQPRRLQIGLEGKLLLEKPVGTERQKLEFSLTLPPGSNRAQFNTIEPGIKEGNRVQAVMFYLFKITDAETPRC